MSPHDLGQDCRLMVLCRALIRHHVFPGRLPPPRSTIAPASTNLEFSVEGLNIVLVDDVLFTGRTIRAAMDALLAHGRPTTVELAVLVDRRFRRELPIEPKYVGRSVDSLDSQRVKVIWSEEDGGEDRVELINPSEDHG